MKEKKSIHIKAWALRCFSPKNDQNGKIIYHKKRTFENVKNQKVFVLTSLTSLICISPIGSPLILLEYIEKGRKSEGKWKLFMTTSNKKVLVDMTFLTKKQRSVFILERYWYFTWAFLFGNFKSWLLVFRKSRAKKKLKKFKTICEQSNRGAF